MADISITAASVVAGVDSIQERGILGETVTAGQALYYDPTLRKWLKADSNAGTELVRKATGIALNGGAVNQPVVVHKSGDLTIGATLTPGLPYFLSDTPGGICLVADVGSGEYVVQVGIAKSASVLTVNFQYPGVAL